MSAFFFQQMFCVVEFLDEGKGSAVEIVPKSWCVGHKHCWWPPSLHTADDLTKLVMKSGPIDESTWTIHSAAVLASYSKANITLIFNNIYKDHYVAINFLFSDNYGEANVNVAKAMKGLPIHSSTDIEDLGKHKRKRKATMKAASASSSFLSRKSVIPSPANDPFSSDVGDSDVQPQSSDEDMDIQSTPISQRQSEAHDSHIVPHNVGTLRGNTIK